MITRLNETTHPSDSDLIRYMDGEGGVDQRQRARSHLGECPSCEQRLSLLRARSAALSDLVDHMQVPEREVALPPLATGTAAADGRGSSSAGRYGGLLKAAVIVLLTAAPALAIVPPVRDWIATQWSELTASPGAPDGSGASVTAPSRSAVSFVPSDRTLNLWLEREGGPETIRIVPAETERVTVESVGPAGDRLVVLPEGVRIENGSDSNARYIVTVPSALETVVVYVAGVEYMLTYPRDEAAKVQREPQDQPET